jgi:hypothetical protein
MRNLGRPELKIPGQALSAAAIQPERAVRTRLTRQARQQTQADRAPYPPRAGSGSGAWPVHFVWVMTGRFGCIGTAGLAATAMIAA